MLNTDSHANGASIAICNKTWPLLQRLCKYAATSTLVGANPLSTGERESSRERGGENLVASCLSQHNNASRSRMITRIAETC